MARTANGVYGTALLNGSTDTVLRKRLRIRMNGNVRQEIGIKLQFDALQIEGHQIVNSVDF